VNHPYPWLKYLDASDIEDADVDFDGMQIESPTGEKLGEAEGFIVDSETGRPYYLVVDAGGWFKSKHFLLPIGHARLNSDTDRDALVADLSRDRINRFPGFDKDEFDKLTPEAIKQMNDEICAVCSVTAVSYSTTEPYTSAWDRADYSYPDWWHAQPTLPDRMGESAFKEMVDYPPAPKASSLDRDDYERASADDRGGPAKPDPSPHYDGRAQPGDVIGLETGGERTYVGDTAEDENKRREDAEKAAAKK